MTKQTSRRAILKPAVINRFRQVADNRYRESAAPVGKRPRGAHRESFGLRVKGNCLSPKVSDGQIAVVDPRLPKVGDIAVFWFKGQDMPTMKILCTPIFGYPLHPESECVPLVEVEALNPPKRYSCRLDQVECIARVHSVI